MAQPLPHPQPEGGPAAALPPSAARPWTYERYCAIPDDGNRYEVIGGKLYQLPSPDMGHQETLGALLVKLMTYIKAHDVGKLVMAPFDVVLSEQNVVQPDLLFVTKERRSVITNANASGSPDLVIEILLDFTAAHDRGIKADAYAVHGVPHFWIVSNRSQTIEAYELRDGDYALMQRLTSEDTFEPALFPGLSIRLADLWS